MMYIMRAGGRHRTRVACMIEGFLSARVERGYYRELGT